MELGVTTIMMCLFFGTNAILFLLFYYVNKTNNLNMSNEIIKDNKKEKELSKPFIGTIDCYYNLTFELFRTGLIMLFTYICERHWYYDHSTKSYNRDLFIFVLIIFFGYGYYTIKPVHDLTLLSREQTEEWKGWMQFIFLLYHYFHAEEVYNSVRVMITCYVWMTGFGNFSFFYIKRDYGWLRVVQMLWRLNFSVFLLMWTHGNTWILYYICPMHTFYFLMVYTIMFLYSSLNHTKWGIRIKLLIAGIIIFIIWDINYGLFDLVFAWLGTDSVIGAKNGSVWEYYFRTSLDHWSSYLGMIFALNFPISEQYFHKAKGFPLIVGAIIFAILSLWWFFYIYKLEKFTYNLYHSYFAIIPLTSYIFFRNITPFIRSGVSMSLHDLGKTTLETYLLQHHVWLTSNAKTLLTIIPGYPWINFALATILFFTLSKELYRLTMSLRLDILLLNTLVSTSLICRGMILPDDHNIAFTNMIGSIIIMSILYMIALILHGFEATLYEIGLVCCGLTLVTLLFIYRFARQTSDNYIYQNISKYLSIILIIILFIGISIQLSIVTPIYLIHSNDNQLSTNYQTNSQCIQALYHGYWKTNECDITLPQSLNKQLYCQLDSWEWDNKPSNCNIMKLTNKQIKKLYNNKKILFIGDSIIRNSYHGLNQLLYNQYNTLNTNISYKHSNLYNKYNNITLQFIWAPMTNNISNYFRNNLNYYDIIILGSSLWDSLYTNNNIQLYNDNINQIATILSNYQSNYQNNTIISYKNPFIFWLQPTIIVNNRLNTINKLTYMNEEIINNYRNIIYNNSNILKVLTDIINPIDISKGKEYTSSDGVHYNEEIYLIIAQIISNRYAMEIPNFYEKSNIFIKSNNPKKTGSMSFPLYGLFVLFISIIMLITLDGFLGIGYLSLVIFGRSYDWEEAFIPLLKKIGIHIKTSNDYTIENEPTKHTFITSNKDDKL